MTGATSGHRIAAHRNESRTEHQEQALPWRQRPVRNVTFEDVSIVADRGLRCVNCASVSFKSTVLTSTEGVNFPVHDFVP